MLRSAASAPIEIDRSAAISLGLALLAGVLQTIGQVVLASDPEWQGIVTVIVIFVVGEQVDPLHGPAFITALHLPPWLARLAIALIAALGGALTAIPMSHGVHVAIADLLTILAGLGFGSALPVRQMDAGASATLR